MSRHHQRTKFRPTYTNELSNIVLISPISKILTDSVAVTLHLGPKKKARKDVFTVNLNFDGIFTSWSLKYAVRVITDTNFDEMSYEHLKEIAKKLVPHALFEKIYYCQTGVKLTLGLREIKSTQDIAEMMKVGYESGNEIDMYVEHFGYDIMELIKLEVNEEHNHNSIEESDDEYYGSDDYEEIENVDFQTEEDESVVIKSISTHDPFLTKLCSARIMFRGTAEHLQTEEPPADPDQIHAVNKVQSGVLYPAFDPDILWDKMEPTLGMKYETPYHLKLALANYGVTHGYQLAIFDHEGVWVKYTTNVTTEYVDEFPGMETSETTNVAEGIGSAMEEELPAPAVDKGKGVASVAQQDSAPKKKRGRPPSHVDGIRIYHKNRGRSEMIAKMKKKKAFEFDKHVTGSTHEKAFDVSD
ncbi:hypothetical protein Tco_0211668 [Tanacetum coccineum]